MNLPQRIIFILIIAVSTLSEMFPPWSYEDGCNSSERSAGYHFIFGAPPEVKPDAEMKQIFSIPDNEPCHGFSVHIDWLRLYEQRFSMLFLMIGLLLVLDDRKKLFKILIGSISICLGLFFLGVLYSSLFK
jgi:hypothetical protein